MTTSVRFSTIIQQTAAFIGKHFIILLVANVVPLFIAYAVVWLTLGATVAQVNQSESFEQVLTLFSFSSPLTYTILVTSVIVLAINILGWIAGPLLTIEQGNITVKALFPKAAKYFWSYFALALMVIVLGALVEIGVFLIMTIILTIVGFIDLAAIATVENYLASVFPSLSLIIMMVFLLFAPYFLIEEKVTAWQAILRSTKLVWQHFWLVLIYFLLLAGIIILLSFVLQLIPYVGGALSYLVASIVLTVYNYYLYKGLTTPA